MFSLVALLRFSKMETNPIETLPTESKMPIQRILGRVYGQGGNNLSQNTIPYWYNRIVFQIKLPLLRFILN